jgi:NAD+ kinase
MPIEANILALTPISPFRPRRWPGALIPYSSYIKLKVLEPEKRPVNAVADYFEVKNVVNVLVSKVNKRVVRLLFDQEIDLAERIIREQFLNGNSI